MQALIPVVALSIATTVLTSAITERSFGGPPAVAERTGSGLERLRAENARLRQELAIYKLRARDVAVDRMADGSFQVSFRAEQYDRKRGGQFHSPPWRELLTLLLDFQSPIRVYLGATSVRDSDLVALRGCENIVSLELEGTGVTDTAMATVGTLDNLENLNLRYCPLKDAGLVHLAQLHKLRSLNLQCGLVRYRYTEEGIQHLSGLTELRRLDLTFADLNEKSMAHLASLTKLEFLDLGNSLVTSNSLRHLEGMKELQRLNLRLCVYITDAGLAHLAKLPRLRVLNAVHTKITPEGVRELQKTLPELKVRLTNADPYYQ